MDSQLRVAFSIQAYRKIALSIRKLADSHCCRLRYSVTEKQTVAITLLLATVTSALDMWTGLLLLCTHIATVMTSDADQCPADCRCESSATSLAVDCHGVHREQLSDQLRSLLSSNLTYDGRLTSLRVANAPLTQVPRSVCRLTTLQELHLDHNQLTGLPDNCLSNLSNLERFSARDNAVETLHAGRRLLRSQQTATDRPQWEQDRLYRFVGICSVV